MSLILGDDLQFTTLAGNFIFGDDFQFDTLASVNTDPGLGPTHGLKMVCIN